MTRRIFQSIIFTAILAVLLVSVLLVGTLYAVYEHQFFAELRSKAQSIVRALDVLEDDVAYLSGVDSQSRISLISPEGDVLYDNAADIASLENHAQRPEVMQALEQGAGESKRRSDTLSELTSYYALRTSDGNVLRVSYTQSSVLGVFWDVTPQLIYMLLAVTILALVIARVSARKIVAPVNNLNLDEPLENKVYDELSLLLTRMDHQHNQIRQQMRDLARARSEIEAIIQGMREGMILLDTKNQVLSINHSAAKIFGITEDDHVGQDLLTICREAGVLDIVNAAKDGHNSDMYLKQGQKTYRLFASPVMRTEKVRGVVLLILDVTARYAAEASRREFSANVSHELKTPLTSISGYAEIIRDGIARPEDIPAFAGKIHTETKRLIALVNDILELSRLDEKQGLGAKEWVELMPMLQALAEDFTPLAEEKNITLSVEGCNAGVEGYPLLLRELFQNLIDNAIKYTSPGGYVHVKIWLDGYHILCRVQDTGIGIPKEHQSHVFERFYRVDKSHSRATGGTGLGLAIVKHAADVHHASLTLESEQGKGTAITIRF